MFVLDCSVAISWCIQDEHNIYADAVFTLLSGGNQAIIPGIWWLEIINVLLVAERRQRSTWVQTTEALTILRSLPIAIDDAPFSHTIDSVINLGREHNIAAYDAAYLELALRQELLLATIDHRLAKVAQNLGCLLEDPR
ncbi:MAG: type II toxin-antitoxin system VapC family toxin [Cyanobacteria bacterium CRU_2_1]|nr:type II toxin-antitoxin system VapC family toxin [Cyanobacteria bacterium CRU_2_1]